MNPNQIRKLMSKGGLDKFANIGDATIKTHTKIHKEFFDEHIEPKLASIKRTSLENKEGIKKILQELQKINEKQQELTFEETQAEQKKDEKNKITWD